MLYSTLDNWAKSASFSSLRSCILVSYSWSCNTFCSLLFSLFNNIMLHLLALIRSFSTKSYSILRFYSVSYLGARDELQEDTSSELSFPLKTDSIAYHSTPATNVTTFSESSPTFSSLNAEFWVAFIAYETWVSRLTQLRRVAHSNARYPYPWHSKHYFFLESSPTTQPLGLILW